MKRVLHIIESFDGQATENWLYQMMCYMQEQKIDFDWTFFVTLGKAGKFDNLIRNVGGKIIYSKFLLHKKINFMKFLREKSISGGFEIIHSHHDVMSAIYFIALLGTGVEKKIIHIHNTTLSIPTNNFLKKALLREPMRQVCMYLADTLVGVSEDALYAFQKYKKLSSKSNSVVHCGINTALFHRHLPDKKQLIKSLKLPQDSNILLFVGRMTNDKNPLFIIDILRYLDKLSPTICVVFAGVGPLESIVQEIAAQQSLDNRVRVLGWHDDIPALMQSCDMLIWPGKEHIKEGLGLAVVEAQAAGLSVLMSLNVPDEAILIPELVDVLPLAAGASEWAAKIIFKLRCPTRVRDIFFAKVEASSFTISRSTANILALYDK